MRAPLVMRRISVVIACLACTTSGRRAQITEDRAPGSLRQEHQRLQIAMDTTGLGMRESLQHGDAGASAVGALARFLLSFNNAAGHDGLNAGRTWATKRAFSMHRVGPPVASSESSEAERKRIKAERLALKAELAALEIEKLELQAAKMKTKRLEREPAEEVAPAPSLATPSQSTVSDTAPVEKASPPPSGASSFVSDLSSKTTTESESESDSARRTTAYRRAAQLVNGKKKDAVRLSDTQIELAKSNVFDLNNFYVRKVDQTDLGTIFRGNLRTNSSVVFDLVTSKAAKVPELRDVQFLMLQDPTWEYIDRVSPRSERKEEQEPVFLALQAEAVDRDQGLLDLGLVLVGLSTTAITAIGFALSAYILTPEGGAMLQALGEKSFAPVEKALPIAEGLVGLQLLHESAHLVAARVHGLKTGIPKLVPSLQIGIFGSITRLLSVPSNNNALFDFALAGPAVAGAASLALYVAGLFLSANMAIPGPGAADALANAVPSIVEKLESSKVVASSAADLAATTASAYIPSADLMPVVPIGLLQQSLLLDVIARAIVPAASTQSALALHPFALIGFLGCYVNALQLMPVGRLDGGRIANSLLGQRRAAFLSATFTLLFVFSNFFNNNPLLFSWAFFIYFCQRQSDKPSANDLDSADSQRADIAKVVAALAFLTWLPFQGGIPPPGASAPGDFPF